MGNLAFDTDTKLAKLHVAIYAATDTLSALHNTAKVYAGAQFYYVGRRRTTDMTTDDALDILNAVIARNAEASEHERTNLLPGTKLGNCALGDIRRTVARIADAQDRLAELHEQADALDAIYRQHKWSRFFLVTSSAGHIHSSMMCSTCRPSTRYGWLPALSGSTEDAAVAEYGPALCSVCFPTAPVDWCDSKITKAAAAKLLAAT